MKFTYFQSVQGTQLAVAGGEHWYGAGSDPLEVHLQGGADLCEMGRRAIERGERVTLPTSLLPMIIHPPKIVCVGLNYADHVSEGGRTRPEYPAFFLRLRTGLLGHGEAMRIPRVSEQLDFEGELAAVIGKRGRYIDKADALSHVAGYTIFNDGSVRDYQRRTQQWTLGKNFDATGPLGPCFVTADELPPGGKGLRIRTLLDDQVVQEASTSDMIFDVATVIAAISEAMTLEPGDVIATGTPSGVGAWRKPPLWMRAGSECKVEIERIGTLRSPIAAEHLPS